MTVWTSILTLLAFLPQAATPPKFEVASVKPAVGCPAGGRGSGGVGASGISSPGRLDLRCQTVLNLIQTAYVIAGRPITAVPFPRDSVQITGGPAWMDSERYDIDAKAEGAPGQPAMRGPMLQALLEDRFQLKLHRETKDVPVYLLTVAKGGPQRLRPAQEGKCALFNRDDPDGQRPPAGTPLCGLFYPSASKDGTDVFGVTMADLCRQFTLLSDRTFLDKTGIDGRFDIHLDPPPPSDPSERRPADAIIQIVMDQLKLKIESARGSGEFLVIDRVERPSGN